MGFRFVPKSVTLNDLEWRNGRYCELFNNMQFYVQVSTFRSIANNI